MNDNLKTWPGFIYVHDSTSLSVLPAYTRNKTLSVTVQPIFPAEVLYIRADIVKERENKLIKEALTYGYSMADYPARPKDRDIPFVFFNAGLEELK